MITERGSYILLFDGDCSLCNRAVQWVLRRDRKDQFRFGSLQSEKGQKLLLSAPAAVAASDSVILITGGKYYHESTAALKTIVALGGIYRFAAPLMLLPRSLRDRIYRWVARNRKRWWPYDATCMIPRKEWEHKFID
ncbi:MAG: DCC1-like thiol-disulfide oxidoreductase family protein [Chitinophagaceae bacterium]